MWDYKSLLVLLSTALIVCVNTALAQTITVVSATDAQPVTGALVLYKDAVTNTEKVAVTDSIGNATINALSTQNNTYTIRIQCVGYVSLTKKIQPSLISEVPIVAPIICYLTPKNNYLNEVVITAQYAPTLAEKSVQKIKIIGQEKIQAMGATNLRDVLTNELNIRLQQDNILGSSMAMQGMSGENVKILIDGIPMIGRLNGSIDLSQINMNNVARIEVVEGPLSVQYGTNALAGTINIITRKTTTKKYSASITPYYESIGTYNLTADALFAVKKHSIGITGGRSYFDGWNPHNTPFTYIKQPIADTTRFQQWKPKEQYFGTGNYSYAFKKINVGIKSAYFQEKIINRGMPRKPYNEVAFDDYYYTKRIDNAVYAVGKLSKYWNLNLTAGYNYYKRTKQTYYKDLTTLEQITTANTDQDTSVFGLLMSRGSVAYNKDSAVLNYELGYDLSYESVIGKRIATQLQHMGDYALYATAQYTPITKLILKPGLRYAYNTNYTAPLVPSVNVKWDIAPKHTLRASYAKGFRAPTLKELYFLFVDINHNIVGNEALKAEQSNNYSLAYNFTSPAKKTVFKLDYSMFYNGINNLITLAQTTTTQYSYINIGTYKTHGAQLSSSINYNGFTIAGGVNYTGRYNQIATEYAAEKYAYSPEYNTNLAYKFAPQKLTLSLFYKYNGKLPSYQLVNNVVQQSYIAAYQLMDCTAAIDVLNNHVNIAIGCKNIFNITNIATNVVGGVHSSNTSTSPLLTGRNYFVKLSIQLWKR
jgi:outer membrane receptor for ferrienterochelin and colicins